jgi:CBS domain containing-hemolysin-like protein
MSPGLGIAVTALLLLLNAFFVAAEFALVSARRASVEPAAEQGSRRAVITLRAMEQVSLMMAGAQLGITLCSVALGAVSEPVIAHLLEPPFDALGLPAGLTHPAAFVVALALVTVLHVVLGEMVPKNVALADPEGSAQWLAPVLAVTVQVVRPLIWVLNEIANLVLRLFRVQPRDEVASAFTRDEVALLVDESRRGGLLAAEAHRRLGGALAFETATAGVLTLPLSRAHVLPGAPTADDVEALAARTGVTRFPVQDGTVDGGVRGYVHLKDTLGLAPDRRSAPLPASCIRRLPDVAVDASLGEVVEVMRTGHAHMARVARDGATLGIITLDDILASLVQPAAQPG